MAGLETRAARLLGTRYAIVQAPMAGGFTTPELVAAVSNAGALGSLGGAQLAPDELYRQEAIDGLARGRSRMARPGQQRYDDIVDHRGGTIGSPTSPLLLRTPHRARIWPPGRQSRPPAAKAVVAHGRETIA
jgi:NAD(P)H-dependent flavin oxidoreductase YrpB (nitropropane dioxygenase family)